MSTYHDHIYVDPGNCMRCKVYSHLVSLNMVAYEGNSPFVRALVNIIFFFFPRLVDVTKKIASDIHTK